MRLVEMLYCVELLQINHPPNGMEQWIPSNGISNKRKSYWCAHCSACAPLFVLDHRRRNHHHHRCRCCCCRCHYSWGVTIRAKENRNVLISNAVAFTHSWKAEKHVVGCRMQWTCFFIHYYTFGIRLDFVLQNMLYMFQFNYWRCTASFNLIMLVRLIGIFLEF